MPDENQTTTATTNDPVDTGSGASDAASNATEADIDMSGIDPNLKIPSLDDLEYATPSAYIDPDLPENPAPIVDPNEPEEKEPEPEEETLELTPEQIAEAVKASNEVMSGVAEKIGNARNILIALSSDPSVDELAGAIAFSMFLDRLGKHAIAIYSGKTPNALEFLKPDETFEKNADVLQDFVIALDKNKADHLRYKLDGDFVKVYITPYRDRIASEDLEFSYGDYNVDLVLALNVNNGIDLDDALREYGRIMHDAAVVNITTGNPGKFGEVEWSNKFASSVSEMISDLLLNSDGDTKLNAEEATALLTGIVAATDRFAKANTFPSTMQVASRLMDAGADQQLVAANISDDLDNQFFSFADEKKDETSESDSEDGSGDDSKDSGGGKKDEDGDGIDDDGFSFAPTKEAEDDLPDDGTALRIAHGEEAEKAEAGEAAATASSDTAEPAGAAVDSTTAETASVEPVSAESVETNVESESTDDASSAAEDTSLLDELKATEESLSTAGAELAPEPVEQPVQLDAVGSEVTPAVPTVPETTLTAPSEGTMATVLPPDNPAASSTPEVTATPEMSGMPEINYGQTNSDSILPPPPTPPIDINAPMPVPAPTDLPPVAETGTSAVNPNNPAVTAAPDASAFTIPGV